MNPECPWKIRKIRVEFNGGVLKLGPVPRIRWCLLMTALLGWMLPGWGATARLVKVLPQLTDRQGRVALSPSLYERDAYQAYLRKHQEERGGIRFQVQWKSP